MNDIRKIPVTLISGFLGAGKTTFINALLQKFPEIKFALVENEFGEVGIDSKLIKGMDASQMFELKNGCVCCTITDEFELVLKELHEKFGNIDHLIIETTGVADPASIVQTILGNHDLKNMYHLNGTICLIDGLNFNLNLEKDVAIKQIVMADLLVLNKSESLESFKLEMIQDELKKINPFATVKSASFGNVEDFNRLELERKLSFRIDTSLTDQKHINIQTKSLYFNQALNKESFMNWLEYTMDIYKKEIYRVKGVLQFKNEPFEYILQGFGGRFELEEEDIILDSRPGVLVFIGQLENIDLFFES